MEALLKDLEGGYKYDRCTNPAQSDGGEGGL